MAWQYYLGCFWDASVWIDTAPLKAVDDDNDTTRALMQMYCPSICAGGACNQGTAHSCAVHVLMESWTQGTAFHQRKLNRYNYLRGLL